MEQSVLNFDPQPLSQDEGAVLSCLRQGRESALSSTEIIKRTGLTERRIQAVVNKLRRKLYPIVGAVEEPMGYFLASNQQEMVMLAESFFNRGRKYFATGAIFAKQSLRMIYSQESLKCEREGDI